MLNRFLLWLFPTSRMMRDRRACKVICAVGDILNGPDFTYEKVNDLRELRDYIESSMTATQSAPPAAGVTQ